MKYLVNTKTKEILKEAKSIGQSWVDTQLDYEFLELDDAVLEDGSFRKLTDLDIEPILAKIVSKQDALTRELFKDKLDGITIRHLEQRELVSLGLLESTTLSEEEFKDHLVSKQNIRSKEK